MTTFVLNEQDSHASLTDELDDLQRSSFQKDSSSGGSSRKGEASAV
jgi:hypothetical protein